MFLRRKILVDMDVERHTVRHSETILTRYDKDIYRTLMKDRWNVWKEEPVKNAGELCYLLRKVCNQDESRSTALLELLEKHPKTIIFYNFDYERDIIRNLGYQDGTIVAEWNGHIHQTVPTSNRWVYLVQYTSGCEGWNCITTDTIICLLYTSPSPRDRTRSRMPSSA